MSWLKEKFISLADFFYFLIFREHLGEGTKKFIKNLSWMGFGTFGSTLLTMLFTVLLIRLLGPYEYGRASLITSLAAFLQIPILWNLHNAAARFLPNAKNDEEKKLIISTSTILTIVFAVIFGVIFFAFARTLAFLVHADLDVFRYSVIYSLVVVFYLLFSGILRGLGDFKRQSLFYFVSAFVLIGFALYFILSFKTLTFQAFAIPLILRWFFLGLLFFAIISRYFSFRFDLNIAKEIFSYSFFTLIGSIAIVLVQNIDTVMLNYFHSPAVVGVFSAYLMASTVVSGKLLDVIVQVAFPMSAGIQDTRPIFHRVWHFWKKTFLLLIAGSIITTLIGLFFYGRGYPFSWPYILLFSLQAILYSIGSIQFWLITSRGSEGAKFTAKHLIIATLINVILNLILIPRLAITGAVIATLVYGSYLILASRKYFTSNKNLFS